MTNLRTLPKKERKHYFAYPLIGIAPPIFAGYLPHKKIAATVTSNTMKCMTGLTTSTGVAH